VDYDDAYARGPGVFGPEPDEVLVRFADRIGVDLPVLDIGAGQGRHALYVARLGRAVHALEPSAVGARQLAEAAERMGITISVFTYGFETFQPELAAYGAVLVFGLIPDLRREQIAALAERLERWTARDGLVFLTGFTTEDSSFSRWSHDGTQVGVGSFVSPSGQTRTFLAPCEVLGLLPGFAPLFHWEGLGPVHRHGDSAPERHGRFEAVLRRS
jgi:hypothetical protein